MIHSRTKIPIILLVATVLFGGCRPSIHVDRSLPLQGRLEIVVLKNNRRMLVYAEGKLVRTYPLGLGSNSADKVREGDRATPEGEFYVFTKNPESKYYLSLGISYPNQEDAERGLKSGLINADQFDQISEAIKKGEAPPQNTALGGEIYIHGRGSSSDWTWGCVALDDPDMKELFDAARVGTKVTIRP